MQQKIASIVALAGLAAAAAAQDSISTNATTDALSPFDTATQRTAFVVDLAPHATGWGTTFGVAPLVKTSLGDAGFPNNLMSANGISQDLATGVPFASTGYRLWNGPGGGVNPDNNTGPFQIVNPTGDSNQFGVVFADFGGPQFNGVVGSVINYDPAEPGRLYVTRVQAAVNDDDNIAESASQFGMGSIDADGHTYIRADAFGITPDPFITPVADNNIFRVDVLDRDPSTLNILANSVAVADGPATDRMVTGRSDNVLPPANIPASVSGNPRGSLATTDFGNNFISGPTTGTSKGGSFLGSAGSSRGAGAFFPVVFSSNPSAVGTMAGLAVTGSETDTLNLWTVDGDGNVLGSAQFVLPVTGSGIIASDPVDGYDLIPDQVCDLNGIPNDGDEFDNYTSVEFDNYRSQAAFRGGTGQVAVGQRPDGRGIIAAQVTTRAVTADSSGNEPYNVIVVGDFDPANLGAGVNWTIAAWNEIDCPPLSPIETGKPILDGPGGSPIGRITTLEAVTGGAPQGPSLSSPSIDAKGNIWFTAAVELNKVDNQGVPFVDFDSAIVRAIWNGTDGYELDLVLEPGQVFTGQNSGTDYQVSFIGIADNNSIDSGTTFSNAMNGVASGNIDGLDQADPRAVGGFVTRASVTYDSNGDGDFDIATGDQRYQTLFFIGNTEPATLGCSPVDLSSATNPGVPDGALTGADFFEFLSRFSDGDLSVDFSSAANPGVPDGALTGADFFFFLDLFSQGC